MFNNLEFLFSKGVNNVIRNVCCSIIQTNGGKISKRTKYPATFKKVQAYTPLSDTLTHILVNDQNIREADLCNYFNSIGIPPKVKIVHWSWLEACVQAKTLCDTLPFQVANSSLSSNRGVKRSHNSTTSVATTSSTSFVTQVPVSFYTAPLPVFPPVFPPTTPSLPPAPVATSVPSSTVPVVVAAPLKRGKTSDIDCNDLSSQAFASTSIQSMGNGWFLLHNTIDGDRTPSLLFKFSPVQRQCTSVVGFDMDGTIITTKSGTLLLLIDTIPE